MSPPSGKAGKSTRNGQPGKAGKSVPSGKAGKSTRNGQPGKGGKSVPSGKAGKAGTGGKSGQQPAHEAPARGKRARRNNQRRRQRMRTVDETSAGGLVVDTDAGCAALIGRIDRRGRLLWSLPKGHLEAGETREEAAVREVSEETGIDGLVLAELGSIDYWFVAEDRRIHKTVHHYLMRAVGGELSDADLEVTEVAWVPLTELQNRLAYADERRLARRAGELLAEPA